MVQVPAEPELPAEPKRAAEIELGMHAVVTWKVAELAELAPGTMLHVPLGVASWIGGNGVHEMARQQSITNTPPITGKKKGLFVAYLMWVSNMRLS